MAKTLARAILPRLLSRHQIYLPSSSKTIEYKGIQCCSQILHHGCHNPQVRLCHSSSLPKHISIEIPYKAQLQQMLGLKGGMSVTPKQLNVSATQLYLCYSHLVDQTRFIIDLEMPDTYNSWFRVTQLHTWMCFVRFVSEGMEGQHLMKNYMFRMWGDADTRAKKIVMISRDRKGALEMYHESFLDSIFFYDEGLLGDDKTLANSLWNVFFEKKEVDPKHLEFMVGYVRKQIHHLESQSSENIVKHGFMTFLPMYSDTLDRNDPHLQALMSQMSAQIKI